MTTLRLCSSDSLGPRRRTIHPDYWSLPENELVEVRVNIEPIIRSWGQDAHFTGDLTLLALSCYLQGLIDSQILTKEKSEVARAAIAKATEE